MQANSSRLLTCCEGGMAREGTASAQFRWMEAGMRLENWTLYLSAGLLLFGVALLVCVGAYAAAAVQ